MKLRVAADIGGTFTDIYETPQLVLLGYIKPPMNAYKHRYG